MLPRVSARNVIIHLAEPKWQRLVSTKIGAAMPRICAWFVIITRSMREIKIND